MNKHAGVLLAFLALTPLRGQRQDPLDRGGTHADHMNHGATTPVRLNLGVVLLGQAHDFVDHLLGNLELAPPSVMNSADLGADHLAKECSQVTTLPSDTDKLAATEISATLCAASSNDLAWVTSR
jgi:hypothetical protein